jgi:hypothetical protein
LQDHLPNEIESLHQAASTPIETTLARDHWKQITMLLPMTEHFGFHIPAATLANQRHRQQFTIRTLRRWTGSLEKRSYLEPNIIYHYVHPSTKIVEVIYHWSVLLRVWFLSAETPISRLRTFCQLA